MPQDSLDNTFSWLLGMASFPLLPTAQEEEEEEEDDGMNIRKMETEKEKEERKSDHEVARQDVIKVSLVS